MTDSAIAKKNLKVSFFIDRGGTFTDIVYQLYSTDAQSGSETFVRQGIYKLLSADPQHYADAPSEGIRRVLQQNGLMDKANTHGQIPVDNIKTIRMGTTVATNALLERKGAPSLMIVTRGFADLLYIGDQARTELFKLDVEKPHPPCTCIAEVTERLRLLLPEEAAVYREGRNVPTVTGSVLQGSSDILVEELIPVNYEEAKQVLQKAYDIGIRSVGISLMHAYANGQHEKIIGEIAREIGFLQISLSSELLPLIKYFNRSTTTAVNAYLTPLIQEYLEHFSQQFVDNMRAIADVVFFIQSDGGLTRAGHFYGFRAVLSGPAGGVVGCSTTTALALGPETKTVGFDMGGTSTDVSRAEGAQVKHIMEGEIAGVQLQAPQVDVTTVAAGGGSLLQWVNGMFLVGPESAGAFPGPACYGRGGPLAITDANVFLGRIDPKEAPRVFGPDSNEPLSLACARRAIEDITAQVNKDRPGAEMSPEEVAAAFIEVANEAMCCPIRSMTSAKGYNCSDHVLTVFGGAGGQHGCAVARKLGMQRVYVNRYASLLSAVGISLSDIVEERLCAVRKPFEEVAPQLWQLSQELYKSAEEVLKKSFAATGEPRLVREEFLRLRYNGTTTSLMIKRPTNLSSDGPTKDVAELQTAYVKALEDEYEREFGFRGKRGADVILDELRLRVSLVDDARNASSKCKNRIFYSPYGDASIPAEIINTVKVYLLSERAWCSVPVYRTAPALQPVHGPCILTADCTSIFVEQGCTAFFTNDGSTVIHVGVVPQKLSTELHPLTLSLFSHRFMNIAEQMGRTLQRTASSTNIKERLDFSCAIFDPDGALVANAPHIPVHLGAMGATVKWQREHYGKDWLEGEVVVCNHPHTGGSHLPDITVITPCFINGEMSFYVASRGHHADIGGTTPGSMPPFSKWLSEEGAQISSLKLVKNGEFQEDAIVELLMAPGKVPGSSGCRMLSDVLADLRAQVAANHRGINLMKELVRECGLDVVVAYMRYIQRTSEEASRAVLRNAVARTGCSKLHASDSMDDGTKISLDITIDSETGTAVFDFTKTGDQVLGSTNCPRSVVSSAIIYCLRCLTKYDIPLSQGCLAPVTILTRPNSLLDPDPKCAVVAGNVLTSQRVVDVILQALNAAACSQGCMNNFTIGDDTFAYYETIAGGSGATAKFDGCSAVQVHMTNTRITDAEFLEERYPVLLREFSIRRGSGGDGAHKGGDGVTRVFVFLRSGIEGAISSERRVFQPWGIMGGGHAQLGLNKLYICNIEKPNISSRMLEPLDKEATGFNIGGKCVFNLSRGDAVAIHTPGGGGFGNVDKTKTPA